MRSTPQKLLAAGMAFIQLASFYNAVFLCYWTATEYALNTATTENNAGSPIMRYWGSEVSKVVVDALLTLKRNGSVKTFTTDNGPEFADREYISMHPGAPVYFADLYSLWQKGFIENTNMLIRQYIPLDDNFSKLSDEHVAAIQHKINHRP